MFRFYLCNTKRLDGVYIIVVKIAKFELQIFLQMLIDVHFFSFSPHSISKKETFELFWTKIAIGEQCHIQGPNMALKNQFLSPTSQQRMISGILYHGDGTPSRYLKKYPRFGLSIYSK